MLHIKVNTVQILVSPPSTQIVTCDTHGSALCCFHLMYLGDPCIAYNIIAVVLCRCTINIIDFTVDM